MKILPLIWIALLTLSFLGCRDAKPKEQSKISQKIRERLRPKPMEEPPFLLEPPPDDVEGDATRPGIYFQDLFKKHRIPSEQSYDLPVFKTLAFIQSLKKKSQKSAVVVHIWATWCHSCKQDWNSWIQWAQKHCQDYQIWALSIDTAPHPPLSDFLNPAPECMHFYQWIDEDEEVLIRHLDPQWDGSIPFTVVFFKGKRVLSANGPTSVLEQKWKGTKF